ncbi:hypothetical protein NPIRD3C_0945 [Nitrosopumilus piranensis]|uniref:Uncharacterized protein n=1 Tax=Nitrosopumilus piranensis TaxID=1582439 RepID=A0A0C5CAG5_9ARCH|nr:hypothetical protein NPIRD3C_0945 [Nitrosopumilus piranensis]
MENPYTDFVGKVWEQFPQLAQLHNLENTTVPMCNLDQFVESTYHNFITNRKLFCLLLLQYLIIL